MTGRHIFEPFDILEAAQVQTFLQDQAVMRFATTADRFTQLTSPEVGMVTFVLEVGHHEWWDGTDWVPLGRKPSWELLTFTADDVFTKADYPWASVARIRMVGGGGGGGAAAATNIAGEASVDEQQSFGGGGGGGGYAESMVLLSAMGTTEDVTVGAGGAGGSSGQSDGGDPSSFGVLVSAEGGDGGSEGGAGPLPTRSGNAGQGGGVNVGDITIPGTGGSIVVSDSLLSIRDARGGWSNLGAVGRSRVASQSQVFPGFPGEAYGGGGGGAANPGDQPVGTGGNGAAGIVIVELYV